MQTKNPETVKRLKEEGYSFQAIADMLNIGKTTARCWYYDISRSTPVGYVNPNLSRSNKVKNNFAYK